MNALYTRINEDRQVANYEVDGKRHAITPGIGQNTTAPGFRSQAGIQIEISREDYSHVGFGSMGNKQQTVAENSWDEPLTIPYGECMKEKDFPTAAVCKVDVFLVVPEDKLQRVS